MGIWDPLYPSAPSAPSPSRYPFIDVYLLLERKPLFFVIFSCLPCVLISVLVLLGFYMPSDSGEKVTLGELDLAHSLYCTCPCHNYYPMPLVPDPPLSLSLSLSCPYPVLSCPPLSLSCLPSRDYIAFVHHGVPDVGVGAFATHRGCSSSDRYHFGLIRSPRFTLTRNLLRRYHLHCVPPNSLYRVHRGFRSVFQCLYRSVPPPQLNIHHIGTHGPPVPPLLQTLLFGRFSRLLLLNLEKQYHSINEHVHYFIGKQAELERERKSRGELISGG